MDYVTRPLTKADEPVLWDLLYLALNTPKGAHSRDILKQPEFSRYVEGWGRAGDTGFLVSDKETAEVLGAVWYRIPAPGDQRAPEAKEPTPELAFTVKAGQRKRGLGAALLTQLVKANPHHSVISIRAPANNPAVRLYERFGFRIDNERDGTLTLRRDV
jgi:ribosomal protein S18 acetylase RimI-like enzyme